MRIAKEQWRRFLIVLGVSFAAWMTVAFLWGVQAVARGAPVAEARCPFLAYAWTALWSPAVYYYARRFPLMRGRLSRSVAALFLGAAIFVFLLSSRFILLPVWNPATGHWHDGSIAIFVHVMFGLRTIYFENLWTYVTIVAVTHAIEFAERYRDRELRESELQRLLAEQRLELLRAQLHPHFLFNTLHGIATLMNRDVPTAREMLLRFSDLLRTLIKYQEKDVVSLREELAFLERYTVIERMRFDDRLRVVTAIDPKTADCFVPCMILQPLVENAIKHGVGKLQSGGTITISSKIESGSLTLCVTNPVPQSQSWSSSEPCANGDGLGLPNARARLLSLYGPEAELTFTPGDDSGMAQTVVRVPLLNSLVSLSEEEHVARTHS